MALPKNMATISSPFADKGRDTRSRLERYWSVEFNWKCFPTFIKDVSEAVSIYKTYIHCIYAIFDYITCIVWDDLTKITCNL